LDVRRSDDVATDEGAWIQSGRWRFDLTALGIDFPGADLMGMALNRREVRSAISVSGPMNSPDQ